MNKGNKIAIIVIGLIALILLILICIFIVGKSNETKLSDNNKTTNRQDEYTKRVKEVAKIETNGETEKVIITIKNKDLESENELNITNKDIEIFKILTSDKKDDETIKNKVIEYKIYSTEAQKMGITLSTDTIMRIENITNSEKILRNVTDKNIRQKFKERISNYLFQIEYKSALNSRIIEEIHNNSVSIENENLNTKMQQYIKIKEDFRNIENPTEEDRVKCLQESSILVNDMEDLYLKTIRDKYEVTVK